MSWTVSVPPTNPRGPERDTWEEVQHFSDRQEAIEFVRTFYGADDEGKVSLVSEDVWIEGPSDA